MEENKKHIQALEQGFQDMKTKKISSSIIRLFEVKSVKLPSGDKFETEFVKIIRLKKKNSQSLKILYGNGDKHFTIPVNDIQGKENAIIWLRKNRILPTLKELRDAFTLHSELGAKIAGCDYCD